MKQVIQNYRTGNLTLADPPIPNCSADTVLVRNAASLISIGTERSVIELGNKNLLGKARARPDLVRRFVDKAKKEGFYKTFQEAMGRLDSPTALGYSSAGIVVELGTNVHDFSPGDRIACVGAGYASHAEYIKVPVNLCCRIPDEMSFDEASFGMLGTIALHGIRCARLGFGESVAVIGLGLLGLLSVQILKAYGCRVIGTDLDPAKIVLALKLGADKAVDGKKFKKCCQTFSDGFGLDAVILTVATKSDEPINIGVEVSRSGGRIVCVGVADIHPQRNEMWHKELEIIVSRSGGPGTFDPVYENKGIDYPIGYVRWTENRNLAEFIRLMAEKKVDVNPLISHRFPIQKAETVYKNILGGIGGPYVGVVLTYPNDSSDRPTTCDRVHGLKPVSRHASGTVTLGVIGAGLFGKALLLPALRKLKNVELKTISTSSSASVLHAGEKFGFEVCTTNYREIIADKGIQAVVILTPHRMHARMVTEALSAGKHVFVEKPLCISEEELSQIIQIYSPFRTPRSTPPSLMVGYNRRFSPHVEKIREWLTHRKDPMVIHYRVNAGFVPVDHWVHSAEEGGSRVVGEVCHFVDFMQAVTGSNPIRVYAERISGNNASVVNSDNVVIALKFSDGSVGNITYTASGDKAFSREQVEIFCESMTIVMTDFKQTTCYRDGNKQVIKTANQAMGYSQELQHFVGTISGKAHPLILPEEIFHSTKAVFCINRSLETATPISIDL